jgi:cyclic pyranopterin phosphate synthase
MPTTSPDRLIDSFGRVHNNLRISVTDRCNIRCVYCMPETVTFLPRESLLSFGEIERFVRVAATLGID